MEEMKDINGMLDLMIQPAFSVTNGIISHVNAAARSQLIGEGSSIHDYLVTGHQEYDDFTEGCLCLMLRVGNGACEASVTSMGDTNIFVLEQDADQAELQAMALAARELRQPLSNVMTVADRLFPIVGTEADSALQDQVARINRGLYQMLRIIGNMSDAYRYSKNTQSSQQTRDICALTEELFHNHRELIQHAGIDLNFTAPREAIYCLTDEEKLERAISNILSNAIKFSRPGDRIDAKLTHSGKLLYLIVQDSGSGIAPGMRNNVYSRYLREPGIEDSRYGIGLGMVLIRAAAAAHGGTVLIEHPKDLGTRITMTLQIRNNAEVAVRSPMHHIDYAGERDHRLIELSDTLPASVYKKENIN
ncbi:MAG: HAMP domain-containing histidine kinase [Oscillospiraceae bacterium]|nr:HAMP domain-containing histidine kinase [Oscillospiraceae bacterium]